MMAEKDWEYWLARAKTAEHCTLGSGGRYSPSKTAGDCKYFPEDAAMALKFFYDELRHVKGPLAGKPWPECRLVLEEWQENIIATMFGWMRPDGTRRYRLVYIEIPRKAGKSTLSAGIALYSLYNDEEAGAEVYSCAADRDQAKVVFEIAKQNVLANEWMEERSKPYQNAITYVDTDSGMVRGGYKALAAVAGTKHGMNASTVIFDELHAQKKRDLWDAMKTGMGARSQPLLAAITTAGWDRNSICWQQHELACKIRDGILENEEILPVIFAADPEDDWKNPTTWYKAQPNLGVSVPESFYRTECELAQQSPAYENTFKQLYLNIWTEQAIRWIPMDKWDSCNEELPDLDGEPCWTGLDLSSKVDVTAFVMAFRLFDDRIALLPHFWIPEDNVIQREQRDSVPYRLWKDKGFVTFTSGNTIDHRMVRRDINAFGKKYSIQEIAADPWNATQICQELADDDGFTVVEFRQGLVSMNEPSKAFHAMVLEQKLVHGGNPILRWMASNACVTQPDDAGNYKPTKGKSTGRIDGIVASVMAVGRAMQGESSSNYWNPEIGV